VIIHSLKRRCCSSGSIVLDQLDVDVRDHFLHRRGHVCPGHRGAQDRVACGGVLPRLLQCGRIDVFGELADHLFDVNPWVAPLEMVEQHALLHRGQFVALCDRPTTHGVHTII
jgi:hypothetical protein